MAEPLFHVQTRFASLKDWREAERLSQAQAAEILRISQTLYSRLERGAQSAKGPFAKRIVEVTGVPLAVIVGAA